MSRYWSTFSRFNGGIVEAYTAIKPEKLIFIDGGAAGKVSAPFDLASAAFRNVRFEPRGEDEVVKSSDDFYVDGGLWSEDSIGKLHLASNLNASSIFPPNLDFLHQFDDKYGVPARETTKTINIPLRSIDSCVSNMEFPKPNFIKLDIHSAEFPALLGSINSLSECVGLLVETWNTEVHQGQKLHFEVEKFAIENGFEVFDSRCAARWYVKHENKVNRNERARYIGSETLFIKTDTPDNLLLEKAFILSLFGFYSSAQNLISNFDYKGHAELFSAISKAKIAASTFTFRRMAKKMVSFLERKL